ncbi:hypothetical protein E4U54_006783 [Claviceps lovelessii]|nr:hypothetical protein E4U54_006783 [Claviceps lovelessii]
MPNSLPLLDMALLISDKAFEFASWSLVPHPHPWTQRHATLMTIVMPPAKLQDESCVLDCVCVATSTSDVCIRLAVVVADCLSGLCGQAAVVLGRSGSHRTTDDEHSMLTIFNVYSMLNRNDEEVVARGSWLWSLVALSVEPRPHTQVQSGHLVWGLCQVRQARLLAFSSPASSSHQMSSSARLDRRHKNPIPRGCMPPSAHRHQPPMPPATCHLPPATCSACGPRRGCRRTAGPGASHDPSEAAKPHRRIAASPHRDKSTSAL